MLRNSHSNDELLCSFCRKRQDAVGRLISSPSDHPRAYICNECVAVCASVIEDLRVEEIEKDKIADTSDEARAPNPLLSHPLAPELMDAIQQWIREESLGNSAAEEIAEVREIAGQMMASTK